MPEFYFGGGIGKSDLDSEASMIPSDLTFVADGCSPFFALEASYSAVVRR